MKRDAADKWFSDVVRKKAAFTCEHCLKKNERMECCHIFGRAAKSVRWSLDNAVCMCHYCHRKFTENPIEFTKWLETYLGQGHLEILREKWNTKMPTNKKLRLEISKHYREELKKMEQNELYHPISYN